MHRITYVSEHHQKMIEGHWHLPTCPQLSKLRHDTALRMHKLNHIGPTNPEQTREILAETLGKIPDTSVIITPAIIDYGVHTFLGEGVYIGPGVTILDSAPVLIDDRVLIGPNCQLITVGHPVDDVQQRRDLWERAAPIHIEEDAWLGAGVIVLPGVTIGARSVIGAGSVVTRDVPADSVAVGNPARVKK